MKGWHRSSSRRFRRRRKPASRYRSRIPTPPVNIGPRSTPNYESLARAAVYDLPGGYRSFVGRRDDPFFVDLGSIFDLAPQVPSHIEPLDYIPILALGMLCALLGISIMRGVTITEDLFRKSGVPVWLRPAIGGLAIGIGTVRAADVRRLRKSG